MSSTGHRKFVKDYLEQLVRMRSEGKSLKEMREATGFGISRICTALNEAGCRKNTMHEIYAEAEPEAKELRFAEDRKKNTQRITVYGKRYIDETCRYL